MLQKALFVIASLACASSAYASFEAVNCSSGDGSVRYRYWQRFDRMPEAEWTVNGDTVHNLAGGFVSKPVVLELRNRPTGYDPMFAEKTFYVRVKFDGQNISAQSLSAELFMLCVAQNAR
jgi:hypothetical protein